jgi:oligoendopeptidase F
VERASGRPGRRESRRSTGRARGPARRTPGGEYYHYLAESTDSENAEIRDLGAWLEPRLTELANVIRAFELEWIGLPADTADRLLGSPEVAGEAHALSKLRRSVPYTLSEPEERLLNERDATALKAWQTLFNRHVSTLAADFDSGAASSRTRSRN